MPETIPVCAHLNIKYKRIEYPNGSCGDLWYCSDCKKEFIPKPSLLMQKGRQYQYLMGEEVKIKAIAVYGKVDAVLFENNAEMYRVVYWNNSERYAVWLYDWEIERKNN